MVEHTEQAFKLDSEGRRRRTVGEDYKERSKESGKQIVETVAGMLPGIGTAMTVEEIKEELQKQDPNYLKIGLLSGAEVLGAVPAIGPAAKSMIRKGADLAKNQLNKLGGSADKSSKMMGKLATAGKVAEKAFKKGYNVAARVHVYLFGNAIGT